MGDRALPAPAGIPDQGSALATARRLQWTAAFGLILVGGYLGGSGAHLPLAALLVAACAMAAMARPAPFLLAYLVYMPLEEFFLKWIPEGPVYLALRYGPEVGLYALLAGVLALRVRAGTRPLWRRTPVDLPLLGFLGVATVSALASGAPALLVVHGLRWMLRYLVVFYLVVHLEWPGRRAQRWVGVMLAAALVQVALAAAQSALGEPAWRFLAPDYGKRDWASEEIKWDPDFRWGVFGTMGSYFALGSFLALWTLLALAWRWTTRRRIHLATALLLGGGLLLTYSRQAALGCGIGVVVLARLAGRRRLFAAALAVVLAYFAVGAWVFLADVSIPTSNIDRPVHERYLGPFTRDYWRIDFTFGGRSYLVLEAGRRLLADAPLLGQGPGMFGTRASLLYGSPVYERLKIDTRNLFDVWWVDVLGQVGLLGTTTFALILLGVFRGARRRARDATDPWERGLALGVAAAVAGASLSCFFGPLLSDRYLSLYFWFLAGLAFRGGTGRAGPDAATA